MFSIKIRALFFVSFFTIAALLCYGDIIWLKSGERQEGIITNESPDMITYVTAAGEIKIEKNRIQKIVNEPKDVGHIKIGDIYLSAQKYENAAEEYTSAVEINPDNKEAQKKLDFVRNKIQQINLTEKKKNEETVNNKLEKAKSLIADNNFDNAYDILNKLETKGQLNERQKNNLHLLFSDLYYHWGLDRIDKLDNDGAVAYFEKSKAYNPKNKDAQDQLIKLLENVPGRSDEALTAYLGILKVSPERTDLKLKVADIYYNQKEYEKALPYYTDIFTSGQFVNTPLSQKLKDCFKNVIQNNVNQNNYDKAIEYTKEYNTLFKVTALKELYLLQYAGMKHKTKLGDIQGRINIITFLKEVGMDDEAKKEIKQVLLDDPRNPQALAFYNQYAEDVYRKAIAAFEKGDYQTAYELAQQVIEEYPQTTTLIEKASRLMEKADIEKRRQERQYKEKAKDLARNGDMYYNYALINIQNLKSTEVNKNTYLGSDRSEGIANLNRAIQLWNEALKIDSSLGGADSLDLINKINTAQGKLIDLQGRPVTEPIGN